MQHMTTHSACFDMYNLTHSSQNHGLTALLWMYFKKQVQKQPLINTQLNFVLNMLSHVLNDCLPVDSLTIFFKVSFWKTAFLKPITPAWFNKIN